MELHDVLAWVNLGLLVVGFITLWIGFGRKIGLLHLEYAHSAIQQLLSRVGGGNPITASELEKIRVYVARAQRGELLTREEAQEFYNLSKKLESEEPYKTDIGAILLVGLAAFILGFVIGSSNGTAPK